MQCDKEFKPLGCVSTGASLVTTCGGAALTSVTAVGSVLGLIGPEVKETLKLLNPKDSWERPLSDYPVSGDWASLDLPGVASETSVFEGLDSEKIDDFKPGQDLDSVFADALMRIKERSETGKGA